MNNARTGFVSRVACCAEGAGSESNIAEYDAHTHTHENDPSATREMRKKKERRENI